ncbi:MAG: hypothetical protein IJ062_11875 [Firmicutes bacterium]|nr:hypothetical protein [Bacillota bacterium]
MDNTAILSSKSDYTYFKYKNTLIRFKAPYSLEYYDKILKWDNGYLVVMAKYQDEEPEEEYIDLLPILTNLYIDPDEFLKNIERVVINYD